MGGTLYMLQHGVSKCMVLIESIASNIYYDYNHIDWAKPENI